MCGSKPNINSLNIRWVGGYQTINAQHHAQYPQKMRILLGSTSPSPFDGGKLGGGRNFVSRGPHSIAGATPPHPSPPTQGRRVINVARISRHPRIDLGSIDYRVKPGNDAGALMGQG